MYFCGEVTLDDAERALRTTRLTVTRDGDRVGVRWGKGPELHIGLSHEPHVRLEAAEVAETHARPEIARCDRRFEVGFDDLDAVLDETNTLIEVQMTLQDVTGGYITMAWNGNLLAPG